LVGTLVIWICRSGYLTVYCIENTAESILKNISTYCTLIGNLSACFGKLHDIVKCVWKRTCKFKHRMF